MEEIMQSKPPYVRRSGDILKIPTLSKGNVKNLIDAKAINRMSEDYQAGYQAGAAEGAQRLAAEQLRLTDVGASLKNALRDIDERYRNECIVVIEQLFTAIAPSMARQSALAETNQIVQTNVVAKKQPLTIRAHPELIADLAMTDAEDISDTVKISIEADDQLNPNAVDIRWADGGMFFDADALIAEISRIFAGNDKSNQE